MAQYRGTRLVEGSGQVLKFRARHRIETGIHADAGASLAGTMIRRRVHGWSRLLGGLDARASHVTAPTYDHIDSRRLCKTRSVCQSWWPRYTLTPAMSPVAIHRPVRLSRGVCHTNRRLNGPSAVTVSTAIQTG
jgi:hypothetical protein